MTFACIGSLIEHEALAMALVKKIYEQAGEKRQALIGYVIMSLTNTSL
jgi:hypothetical protein